MAQNNCQRHPNAYAQTRIDVYVRQLHEHRHLLPARINYLGADGFYAKQKYVNDARACHLHLIAKLRCDADLRFLYTGKREKQRGRSRRDDGKVDFQDLSRFQYLGIVDQADHLHLYTAVLYHVSLKRRLRVVVVVDCRGPDVINPGSPAPGASRPDRAGCREPPCAAGGRGR